MSLTFRCSNIYSYWKQILYCNWFIQWILQYSTWWTSQHLFTSTWEEKQFTWTVMLQGFTESFLFLVKPKGWSRWYKVPYGSTLLHVWMICLFDLKSAHRKTGTKRSCESQEIMRPDWVLGKSADDFRNLSKGGSLSPRGHQRLRFDHTRQRLFQRRNAMKIRKRFTSTCLGALRG